MRISEVLARSRPTFSFEFFPPKTDQGERQLYHTLTRLRELEPSFVSVTYGAGGSTRERTLALVRRILHDLGIETMAHLTCVGASRDELAAILQRLCADGIENLLALRGDPPREHAHFVRPAQGFGYASELVGFVRMRRFPLCVGAACYPEGHVECRDLELDITHLKTKVDAGVDFLITQLFFDNEAYFSFVERARAHGVAVPIIPGIMPITNRAQIERFTAMCGASIPPRLRAQLAEGGDDEAAVRRLGVEYATAQCRDLLARGVPGIHFYTLNQSTATRAVFEHLQV